MRRSTCHASCRSPALEECARGKTTRPDVAAASGSSVRAGTGRSGPGSTPARHRRRRDRRPRGPRSQARPGGLPSVSALSLEGSRFGKDLPRPRPARHPSHEFNGWCRPSSRVAVPSTPSSLHPVTAAIPVDGSESSVSLASAPDAMPKVAPVARSGQAKNTGRCRIRRALCPSSARGRRARRPQADVGRPIDPRRAPDASGVRRSGPPSPPTRSRSR